MVDWLNNISKADFCRCFEISDIWRKETQQGKANINKWISIQKLIFGAERVKARDVYLLENLIFTAHNN